MSSPKAEVEAGTPIVAARGLAREYPMGADRVVALDGVDLDVAAGDYVGIMGPSGSGKSTLLHILGGLDRPTRGTYRLGGEDVAGLSDRALSRIRGTRIGFVFQSYNLAPQLTVLDNVAMPFLYQSGVRDGRRRAEEAAERVGLGHRLRHRPPELSGGERQRAAIARALVVEPLLILADEPTGNLDSATGARILDLFGELNEQGATLVVATHDPDVAARCRRTLLLRDGRWATEGAP